MKKRIITTAIACALPALAHADVTISGVMAVGLDSLQYAGNNNATSTANAPAGYATNVGHTRTTGIDDFASEIIIQGNEDLGNGMKSIWKISNGFDADGVAAPGSGQGVLADRETFVGLDDATYGSIKMGRLNDTLLLTESTDNFYGPRRDYGFGGGLNVNTPLYEEGGTPLGGFGALSGDGRIPNSVRYDSPNFNGFSYNLDFNASENNTGGHMAGDQYGVHVNYSNAETGLFIGGAYKIALNQAQNSAGTHNGYTERLEGGYNGDALTVAFTLNRDSLYGDDTSGTANAFVTVDGLAGNTAAHLTGNSWGSYIAYQIGNWKPQIEYSQRFNSTVDGVKLQTGAREASFELDYALSKRTMAIVGYAEIFESAGLQALQGDLSDVDRLTYTALVHRF
jgi:predicted porin